MYSHFTFHTNFLLYLPQYSKVDWRSQVALFARLGREANGQQATASYLKGISRKTYRGITRKPEALVWNQRKYVETRVPATKEATGYRQSDIRCSVKPDDILTGIKVERRHKKTQEDTRRHEKTREEKRGKKATQNPRSSEADGCRCPISSEDSRLERPRRRRHFR